MNKELSPNSFEKIQGTEIYYGIYEYKSFNGASALKNYTDYLYSDVLGWDLPQNDNNETEDNLLLNRCFKLFKHSEDSKNMAIKDAVDQNLALMVGYRDFVGTIQDLNLDDNDNLLLKTTGFGYENSHRRGGNTLIDKDGKVLAYLGYYGFIRPANALGYYPVEVYKSRRVAGSKRPKTVERNYNFLTPDGKFIRKSHFQQGPETAIHTLTSSKQYVAPSYIYDKGNKTSEFPEYFPTVVDLLISNRESSTPFITNESEYLKTLQNRKVSIPYILHKLSNKCFEQRKMSIEEYNGILNKLNEEIEKIEYFMEKYATNQDYAIMEQDDKEM